MNGLIHDVKTIIILVVNVRPNRQNFADHSNHELTVSRNAQDMLSVDLLTLVNSPVNDKVSEVGILGDGVHDHESFLGFWVISVDRF